MNHRVIALDPGYDRCGVAILEKQSGNDVLLFSDCIETNRNDPLERRIFSLGERIRHLIESYSPTHMAVERLYFNTNQKTAMGVAEARGVMRFLGCDAGLSCFEYTPAQIKVAVTGSGSADKKQVIFMVDKLVSIQKDIAHDDEYDAIAVGITHLAHTRV